MPGRYVQLPINAGMPEAWKEAWQPLPARAGDREQEQLFGSLLEAASHLGVGVFASGPLQEGKLIQESNLQVSSGTHGRWHLHGQMAM